MYTLFSAWKFYTKERVLLKKYLRECGEDPDDMSMLTTLDLRKNAEKMGEASARTSSMQGMSQLFRSGGKDTDFKSSTNRMPSPYGNPHLVNSEQ